MLTALGATCGQVPEASPEIGAAEDRVRNYRKQQYYGDRGAQPTGSSDLADTSVNVLGPYGVSRSMKPPPLWNRRLMPRSTRIAVVPTAAYKITTAKNMIHTPVFAVTASSTFIML
jgi:hypothetical protein